ncbi:hypothetical protein NA56DRAFT_697846 [Hyaloscypha hepaticicola]|uniref:Uncharacterized protein n=1 Tax=Hyaloscypha hepaticicola TaxID=2082293 RepID=A0A2J6QK34_9HELO|nr:hypothetical protein NA56DRAFT_697846 [Hyaloscypha hepaticicola]
MEDEVIEGGRGCGEKENEERASKAGSLYARGVVGGRPQQELGTVFITTKALAQLGSPRLFAIFAYISISLYIVFWHSTSFPFCQGKNRPSRPFSASKQPLAEAESAAGLHLICRLRRKRRQARRFDYATSNDSCCWGQAYFAMAKGDAAQSLGELGRWLEDSTALPLLLACCCLLRSNLDGASTPSAAGRKADPFWAASTASKAPSHWLSVDESSCSVLSCDLPAARLWCAPLFPLARTLEADRVCTVHGGPQWHPTLSSHPRNSDSQATSLLPGFGCLRQPGLLWGVSTHESSNHRWAISLTNRFTNDTELQLDALNQQPTGAGPDLQNQQIFEASSTLPRSCNWNLAGYRTSVYMRRAGVDYPKRYLIISEHRSHL